MRQYLKDKHEVTPSQTRVNRTPRHMHTDHWSHWRDRLFIWKIRVSTQNRLYPYISSLSYRSSYLSVSIQSTTITTTEPARYGLNVTLLNRVRYNIFVIFIVVLTLLQLWNWITFIRMIHCCLYCLTILEVNKSLNVFSSTVRDIWNAFDMCVVYTLIFIITERSVASPGIF